MEEVGGGCEGGGGGGCGQYLEQAVRAERGDGWGVHRIHARELLRKVPSVQLVLQLRLEGAGHLLLRQLGPAQPLGGRQKRRGIANEQAGPSEVTHTKHLLEDGGRVRVERLEAAGRTHRGGKRERGKRRGP